MTKGGNMTSTNTVFKDFGDYLKIAAILLCFYYILITNLRNF